MSKISKISNLPDNYIDWHVLSIKLNKTAYGPIKYYTNPITGEERAVSLDHVMHPAEPENAISRPHAEIVRVLDAKTAEDIIDEISPDQLRTWENELLEEGHIRDEEARGIF